MKPHPHPSKLSTHYWGFWYALCFLTRLPTPYLKRADKEVEHTSLWYYPAVGILLGGLMCAMTLGVWYYSPQASLLIMAALLLTFWTYSTGAMHLDGVADMADAWVGGLGNVERTLEIMRDPRIGSMGAVSILLVLLLKFTALHSLLSQAQFHLSWLFALLLIPALARIGVLALMYRLNYVRAQGMASNLKSSPLLVKWLVLSAAAFTACWLFMPQQFWAMLITWGVFLLGYRALLKKRLGGYTGDTLGAAVELQEVALLIAWVL